MINENILMLGRTCQTRQVATTLRRNPQNRLWSEDQRNRVETRTVRHVTRALGLWASSFGKAGECLHTTVEEEGQGYRQRGP